MKTNVFILLFFMALIKINAQTKQINDRIYEKIDGLWYQIEGSQQYLVSENVITVKFISSASERSISSFILSYNLTKKRQNALGFYDFSLNASTDVTTLVEELNSNPIIEIVELNTLGSYNAIPDDQNYTNQWYLGNESLGGIDAEKAWNKTTGDPSVKIAIIDSGTEISHSDLNGNIWVNPGEDLDGDGVVWDTDDMNGIDDDGNGLIDDLNGWDFYENDNEVPSTNKHGTHVAGIAGASTNNINGIAGVAGGWSGNGNACRLLICGVGVAEPEADAIDDAILYAAQEGAKIISMSLHIGYTYAIDAAITSAYNNYGCFVDCAAGNYPIPVMFPANHQNCFAVSGSYYEEGVGSKKYIDHAFGENLDILAPGYHIYSTKIGNSYQYGTGTSFAAPQAAAVAGLILSYYPYFNNEDIKKVLCITAEKCGDYDYSQIKEFGT
jgi:subtilisin family serine protease